MHLTSERRLDDGVLERRFTLDDIPGVLWTSGPTSGPSPLILVGHPGGLDMMYARVAGRARYYVTAHGYAAATLELPGSGDRPRSPTADQARADLRTAMAAGAPIEEIVDRLVLPLVDQAVPELQAALDMLLGQPGISGPVGLDGGLLGLGIRLARVEPRIAAAVLFAGTFVPRALVEEAREVAVPLQVLLQWDDAGGNRQQALDLYDAFGSSEKTLHANLGGHTGVPAYELEAAGRFFDRHLRDGAH